MFPRILIALVYLGIFLLSRSSLFQERSETKSTIMRLFWKGKLHYEYLRSYKGARLIPWGEPISCLIWRTVNHEETSASLSTININLLFSSKTVSQEAAMVFYNKNTFAFEGDHNWDPIVLWLKTIGIDNRNSLAVVECGKIVSGSDSRILGDGRWKKYTLGIPTLALPQMVLNMAASTISILFWKKCLYC
ncbi:hypothetical protein CJF30_00004379 [Rutstroemia sp. NJR-2017a BBW]|nr:hypothetical protein CJF30_00004379 [Rutstroemia sp. NJR-2017a BBW]